MSALPPRRSPRPRLQPMRTRRVHQDRLASKVADHHAGRAGRRACRLSPPHSASHGQAEHRIVITRWSRGEITDAAAQAVHARKAVARGSQCRSATKRTGGFPRVTAGLPRHPTPSNSSDRRRVMVSRAFVAGRTDMHSLKGMKSMSYLNVTKPADVHCRLVVGCRVRLFWFAAHHSGRSASAALLVAMARLFAAVAVALLITVV